MSNHPKLIRVFNKDKTHKDVSPEELISLGINKWKGWACSAGKYLLYIDYDGNVFTCNNASSKIDRFNHSGWKEEKKRLRAEQGINVELPKNVESGVYRKYQRVFERSGNGFQNSLDANDPENYKKHFGFLGNINQHFKVPNDFVICPFAQCGCGADVPIPKSQDVEGLQSLYKYYLTQFLSSTKQVDSISSPYSILPRNFPYPTILWDIGRKCNYDCSYCWPAVHNAKELHVETNLFLSTCEKIINEFSPKFVKTFCFSGGEPTLHPGIQDILQYLHDKKQRVLLTTNGSMPSSKWEKLTPYINVAQMSAHFEFINKDRFIKNVEIILNTFSKSDEIRTIDIKLMTSPGKLEQSLDMKNQIESIPLWKELGQRENNYTILSLVPLRGIDNSEALLDYKNEELEVFQHQ